MMTRYLVAAAALLLTCSSVDARPRHHDTSAVVGGRPAGCPRAYCGCGTSLEHFGRIVPGLNLARAWYRFPRAAAAPNMVGVRPGHVLTLKEHVSGSVWMVKDYNSGRGLTRYHARDISGYTIVNPHGATI